MGIGGNAAANEDLVHFEYSAQRQVLSGLHYQEPGSGAVVREGILARPRKAGKAHHDVHLLQDPLEIFNVVTPWTCTTIETYRGGFQGPAGNQLYHAGALSPLGLAPEPPPLAFRFVATTMAGTRCPVAKALMAQRFL